MGRIRSAFENVAMVLTSAGAALMLLGICVFPERNVTTILGVLLCTMGSMCLLIILKLEE